MGNRVIIHGCLVAIDGTGVLIVSDAGVGKTTVSLELARLGHNFIADDAVLIRRIYDDVIGSAPAETMGRVAVRGIGICRRIQRGSELSASIGRIVELVGDDETLPQFINDEMLEMIPRDRLKVSESTAKEIESFVLETERSS